MLPPSPARERPARTGWIERVAALLEGTLGWLVGMALGVALIGAVLQASQLRELHALRLDRVQHLLVELRERLEADMASGLDLAPGSRAQSRIEEALANDAGLRGIDIVGTDGLIRLSTDRSAVGDVPHPALSTSTSTSSSSSALVTERTAEPIWQLAADDDTRVTWLATPLADAAGQIGGRLVVSYTEPADTLSQALWHWVALAMLGLPAVCALLLFVQPPRGRPSAEVEQAQAALQQTRLRLRSVAEELKALEATE